MLKHRNRKNSFFQGQQKSHRKQCSPGCFLATVECLIFMNFLEIKSIAIITVYDRTAI